VKEGDNQMLHLLKGKENSTAVKLPRQCPIDLLVNVVGNSEPWEVVKVR
jgi:hypothetical protein